MQLAPQDEVVHVMEPVKNQFQATGHIFPPAEILHVQSLLFGLIIWKINGSRTFACISAAVFVDVVEHGRGQRGGIATNT